MYFRTSNYGIRDSSREAFDIYTAEEELVTKVALSSSGVVVAQGITAYNMRDRCGKKKKLCSFDKEVSAVSAHGDFVVCADGGGVIKLVANLKSVVRQYDEHEARVNEVRIYNGRHMVSCSDDMSVKFYDVAEKNSFHTLRDNTDYVKSVDIGDGVVYTGSYDRSINGYSLETFEKVFSHRAHDLVSKVCYLGDRRLAFVCRNQLFVVDTGAPRNVITAPLHTKEITKLMFYKGRLYTSSLDASFRVLTSDLRLVSKLGFKCGILDFDVLDDLPCLALENGEVVVLRREETKEQAEKRTKRSGLEDEIEYKLIKNIIRRYDDVEKMLNRQEYKRCMLGVIEGRDIQKIFAVLVYLRERQAFRHTLFGLDRKGLCSVLDLIAEYFNQREFVEIFTECLEILVSFYEREMLDDEELGSKLETLSFVVDDEACFQERALRTISFLECFTAEQAYRL
jgi:U3 small nucleolar RNA-associated protein 15